MGRRQTKTEECGIPGYGQGASGPWSGCIPGRAGEADGQQGAGGRTCVREILLGLERRFYFSVSSGEFLNWKIASSILLFEKCFHRHGYDFHLNSSPAG